MTIRQKWLCGTAAVLLAAAAARPGQAGVTRSVVRLETSKGNITAELYGGQTPITVHNFLEYAHRGFYNGVIFHRVINNFMIQTGAYGVNLYAFVAVNPDLSDPNWVRNPLFYREPNAPIKNEAATTLKNLRGTLAMARQSAADSATSQFFINQKANPSLDKTASSAGYCVFGKVLTGLDVVDAIAAVPTYTVDQNFQDLPRDPVVLYRALELWTFEDNSGDLTQAAFLGAAAGLTRTWLGQKAYAGQEFTDRFTAKSVLNVNCLEWQRSALAQAGGSGFTLTLARDNQGALRVFKYVVGTGSGAQTRFEAASLAEVKTLGELLGDEEMSFRLIAGRCQLNNAGDPANRIVTTTGGVTRTQQIVSVAGQRPELPFYRDELVVVRDEQTPGTSGLRWSFYHGSVGLVLDLLHTRTTPGDANYFDPADPAAPARERDGWRLGWYGLTRPVFGAYSNDFSNVNFLKAKPGTLRPYRGQGAYQGLRYLLACTPQTWLTVPGLLLEESAVPEAQRPAGSLLLARDAGSGLWLLRRTLGSQTEFEAPTLDDAFPLRLSSDLALRLPAGAYRQGDTLSQGSGEQQETMRVVSVSASLENRPKYGNDLVLLKGRHGQTNPELEWSYYDSTVGLVLDLWPEPAQGEVINPNGTGWALAEPNALKEADIWLKADRNRLSPSDGFRLLARSDLPPAEFGRSKLYLSVGPWSLAADTAGPGWEQLGQRPVYRYVHQPGGGEKVVVLLDLRTGQAAVQGQGLNLTGLVDPVPVEMSLGGYYARGTARVRGAQGAPLLFQRGYADALAGRWFRFAYDNGPNSATSYQLTVVGEIAAQTTPFEPNSLKTTIKWGASKTYTIDKGKFKALPGEKYLYRNPNGTLRSAWFDLANCRFMLVIKGDNLSVPPQDLQIKFEDAAVRFDKTVRIKVGG